MFARVNYNRSIRDTLGYNERKLKLGKAVCILAENFLKDVDRLSRKDKLYRFERLNVLNEKTKANTLHISLSFHPSDKLENEQMAAITRKYMEKLHLDQQPYLAYRHNDTGHPHLHIVSTLIEADGNRVKLDDILRYQSLRVTREMEQGLSLVRGYLPDHKPVRKPNHELPLKVVYGEPGRKEAVTQVLDHVIDKYTYTSLEELNAALRLYNVKAKVVMDKESSKPRGLMYHTLDEKGHLIGLSFKASSFPSQPTLKKLEQRYALNQSLHRKEMNNTILSIDYAFGGRPKAWEAVQKDMLKEGLYAIPDKDKSGEWKNIYYVDMSNRCVYDGKALGSRYDSQGLRARCANEEEIRLDQTLKIKNQFKLKHHRL